MNIYDGNICDTSNIESNSFLQLNSCGIQYPCKRDLISFRKTGRADYHIIYIIDGVCKVKYDNKSETLKKGGFILYPPNMPQLYKEYMDTKKIWIHFNGFSVDEILRDAHLSCGIHHTEFSAMIEKNLIQLISEYNSKLTVSNEKGLLLYTLFALGKLVNNAADTTDKINDCISFIVTHYTSEISIEDMAASCNLSKSRFLYLFKERVGTSPHAYQQTLRIDNSKHLLATTNLPIADISRISGYQDPLYFSRLFKKNTGVSPLQYRKILHKNTDD